MNEKRKEFRKHIFVPRIVLTSLIEIIITLIRIIMVPQKLGLAIFASINTSAEFVFRTIQEWFFARKSVLEVEKGSIEIKKFSLNKELILLLKV